MGSNQRNTDAPILEAHAIFRLCLWLGAFLRLASQKIPMCRGLPFIEPYLSANFIRELLVNGAKRNKASIHGTLPPMNMDTGQNENHQKTAVSVHVSKIAGFHVGVTRFLTTATCSLLQNLPTRNATQGLPCVAGQAASGDLMWTGDLLPSKISPSLAVWIRGSGFEALVLGGKWETTSSPLNIQKPPI